MRFKKERYELVFQIQSNIYDRAFLRKQLTAKSFIVDIRPGSKYPSDERNKLFSFQIKATLKVTALGTRMCSTELLLWKNQKGSTCYPTTLFKRDSITDNFLEIFNFFWASYFKKQLPTTRLFICLERQMIIVFVVYQKSGTWDPKVGPGPGTQDPRVGP